MDSLGKGGREEERCEGRSCLFPLLDRALDFAAGFTGFDRFATIVLFLPLRQGYLHFGVAALRKVDAQGDEREALQLGLVNHVTTAESLLERTKDILTVIRSKAPIAVGKIIECVNVATVSDSAYTNGKSGYDKEMEAFGDCFVTEDMKEGTSAFLEKRKANFKGK